MMIPEVIVSRLNRGSCLDSVVEAGVTDLLTKDYNFDHKFTLSVPTSAGVEKYEQLKANSNVQVGSETDDHLFLKASGGWSNKGTIYGLGREGPLMFERPAKVRRVSGSSSAAYTSPVVTELQGRLQSTQDELQTTRAELLSTREELQTTKEELAATKKQLDDTRLGF